MILQPKRFPDRVIGLQYLQRWHLVPRNRFLNIYLHRFLGSDPGRHIHDHPWENVSILLTGRLVESTKTAKKKPLRRFLPRFRRAEAAHRLYLESDEAWTLFITGPRRRKWGFHTEDGWVYWRDYPDA